MSGSIGWAKQASQPTFSKRLRAVAQLEDAEAKQAREATEQVLSRRWWMIDKSTPAVKAQRFMAIRHDPGPFGSIRRCIPLIEARGGTYRHVVQLAFALAAYRHQHGAYPNDLAKLAPKYIDTIPTDPFTGGDLHYRLEDGGYLLYSVGPNGKDDGGRNFNEEYETWSEYQSATEEEKLRDDIAIRTPVKKREKR